jgi:hypothetical protein
LSAVICVIIAKIGECLLCPREEKIIKTNRIAKTGECHLDLCLREENINKQDS